MFTDGTKDQVYLLETAFTKQADHVYWVRVRVDGDDKTSAIGIDTTYTIGNNCLNSVLIGNTDPGACETGCWAYDNPATTGPGNAEYYANEGGPFTNQDWMYWANFAVDIRADSMAWLGPPGPGG